MPSSTVIRRTVCLDRDAAFSMIETLIAMAIFAIAFVAIASVFPVAAILQKKTTDDLLAQQVAHNAKTLIQARKFRHTVLTDTDGISNRPPRIGSPPPPDPPNDPDLRVHPILQPGLSPQGVLDIPLQLAERWQLNDRSYFFVGLNRSYHPQQTQEMDTSVSNLSVMEYHRKYYWVPLIRRMTIPASPSDWQVYVFILRGGEGSHHDYVYNRNGVADPWVGWANYDGPKQIFVSGSPDWAWHVPGIYGMPVSLDTTDPTKFQFNGPNGNLYAVDLGSVTNEYEVQVGDQVLDNNGTIHIVQSADANGINVRGPIPRRLDADGTTLLPNILWYGRPGGAGQASPTKLIITVSDAVE